MDKFADHNPANVKEKKPPKKTQNKTLSVLRLLRHGDCRLVHREGYCLASWVVAVVDPIPSLTMMLDIALTQNIMYAPWSKVKLRMSTSEWPHILHGILTSITSYYLHLMYLHRCATLLCAQNILIPSHLKSDQLQCFYIPV